MEEVIKDVDETTKALEELGFEVIEEVENRTFNLIGEISEDTLRDFCEWKEKLDELESPVKINIHSNGGCAASMFGIIGMMEDFKEIHGRVLSSCYSAALGIFASCHKKSMTKYAEVMFHLALYSVDGNINDHKEQLKLAQKLQDKYEDAIINGSNLTKKDFKRSKDWYMDRSE